MSAQCSNPSRVGSLRSSRRSHPSNPRPSNTTRRKTRLCRRAHFGSAAEPEFFRARRVPEVNGAPPKTRLTLGLPNSPNLALWPNQAPQMVNRRRREVVTNCLPRWNVRKRKRRRERANGHEQRRIVMRAPPSTIFLTSREKRDPLGESQKRRRPRSLHNSTGDLVPLS